MLPVKYSGFSHLRELVRKEEKKNEVKKVIPDNEICNLVLVLISLVILHLPP